MYEDILSKLPEIDELCRQYHVVSLAVFGSAVNGDFDPTRSDLDFAVEYSDQQVDAFEDYWGLKEALEDLFGRRVDLVVPSAQRNKYFLDAMNESLRPLYAA